MKKKILKSFSKILLAGTIAMVGVSCGGSEEQNKNVLHVYSWAEYIPTEVFEGFEKETGIKVMEDIYSTNEEMFTKLKAGYLKDLKKKLVLKLWKIFILQTKRCLLN